MNVSLFTSAAVDPIPRAEHPRPQFVRSRWLCLNGEWSFAFDPGDSGEARGFVTHALPERIQVPFCPESPLSGHAATDFLNAVWYRRVITVPAAWGAKFKPRTGRENCFGVPKKHRDYQKTKKYDAFF